MTRAVKGGCERSAAFGNFTTFSSYREVRGFSNIMDVS